METLKGSRTPQPYCLGRAAWPGLVLLYASLAFNVIAAQRGYEARQRSRVHSTSASADLRSEEVS